MTEILNDLFCTTDSEAAEGLDHLHQSLCNGEIPDITEADIAAVEDDSIPADEAQSTLLLQADENLLQNHSYLGDFYGVGCAETGQYYLLANDVSGNSAGFPKLGRIVSAEEYHALMDDPSATLEGCTLFGAYVDGCWSFRLLDECRSYVSLLAFGLVSRLFSRNKGLLESDSMMEKTAIIVGQGSAGSMVALYLARSGVGRFILIDNDILDIHNICRHQLDHHALGQYKVDAMRKAILGINPKADVKVFRGWLEDAPMELFSDVKDGIVVGTADVMAANALANELAKKLNIPFSAVGGWTRCHAGEVFYWKPDSSLSPYGKAFHGLIAASDPHPHANPDYFADDHDRETLNYEPGTAVDLGFITMVSLKFDLDLINLNNEHYTPRVLNDYTNYTLICNTNNPKLGGENAVMFPKPMYISSNITLSADAPHA